MLFITLMLLTMQIGYSKNKKEDISDKVIVIDPGHGGKDAGTSVGNVLEKDINLSISLFLKKELEKKGVKVIMTRDGDYDLSSPNIDRRKKSDFDNRINLINNSNADLYISIHINYLADARVYGAQVFYTKSNEELALVMQNELKSSLNSPLESKLLKDSIYMYKKLKVPGVLIECGFLSNYKDKKLLLNDKYREKLVNSIINSIIKFYSL